MHALLVTFGTDGDVFPYIGLGVHLRSRGHRVTLAAPASHQRLAEAHGLAFHPLTSDADMHALLSNPDFWHPVKTATHSARWGVRLIPQQYELLTVLADAKDTLLVANPGLFAAALVHEKLGRPMASVLLQPGLIPSSIQPPVMPVITFPPWTPRPALDLFWRLLDGVGDQLVSKHLNPIRASLGLKPMRRIFANWLSPQLVLGFFPDWYGPPQADWPPQLQLIGFPMFNGGNIGELAPELREFCRQGEPPVVFTFGTGMMHAEKLFQAAVEACRQLGVRGLFLTKYPQQLPASLPAHIRPIEFAPFTELFPHCAAVVHHGGIGTAAKSLAAGTPQLIIPFAFDQMDNAARVKRLGAGDSLKLKRVNAATLARALKPLLASETRARCQSIATRFTAQNPFAIAAHHLETLAARHANQMPLQRLTDS